MAQMRPRDRQLLWLAYAEGYSHHEIAEVTGLASASIRLLPAKIPTLESLHLPAALARLVVAGPG
jgi:Tfp pilus assembly ATPase PilU